MPERTKRCRCGKTMRRQFDDLFNCVCGMSWLESQGYFYRTKDMVVETVTEKVGNQVRERRVIHKKTDAAQPTELPTKKTVTTRKAEKIPEASHTMQKPVYPAAPSDELVRGGIYYIKDSLTEGAEIHSGRPAILVSDVKSAYFGNTVSVVYLTSREKLMNATRVKIYSAGDRSIALCETIDTIDVEKVGTFIAMTTPKEMMEIKCALAAHLGIRKTTNS